MRKFALPMFGLMILAATVPAPVHAQGDGGYAPDCPGAETVRMSGEERERARAAHQTNDTNGGFSSIDKSCKTWEGGGTRIGPVPGTISYGRGGTRWGWGGAHTGM
ncbi:MAG: hypothetical protein H0U98_06995 [Alphaproteobacteria bacterium]|nr:hypothetical protein [Alphaproteobacteria bacterium]